MGCNSCVSTGSSILNHGRLLQAIDNQNKKNIQFFTQILSETMQKSIDDDIKSLHSLSLNPLSYALVKGKLEAFRYISEELHARIDIMEEKLVKQGTCGINLICKKGHLRFLTYYLPVHLSRDSGESEGNSLSFSFIPSSKPFKKTPVNLACINNHITVLAYLREYFKGGRPCPHELDLHAIDRNTSENCGFIAARRGNLAILKYFHEECGMNLDMLNKSDESILNATALACGPGKEGPFKQCVNYLVDIVKIDIYYKLDETIGKMKNSNLAEFLSKKMGDPEI